MLQRLLNEGSLPPDKVYYVLLPKAFVWLEKAVLIFTVAILVTAAIAFYTTPDNPVFAAATRDWGIEFDNDTFGTLCAIAVFALLLLPLAPIKLQWKIYWLCTTPVLMYCLPIGYYLYVNRVSALAMVPYLSTYGSFLLLALTTFWIKGLFVHADHNRGG